MTDGLATFTDWLSEYIDDPVCPALIRVAERQSAIGSYTPEDCVLIGHTYALIAVASAVKGILRADRTTDTPSENDPAYASALYKIFGLATGLREAGAGGSNPLTPTSKIKEIDKN